jgi:two-component system cell cycle sensor histidine kinase/response regulator CckA
LESQAGFTLQSKLPIIVEDLRTEKRFQGPPLLFDHGVVSGISAIIGDPEQPYGVLGAHTPRRRIFTEDDAQFLQGVAHLLANAEQRQRAEVSLRESEARFRSLIEGAPEAIFVQSDGCFVYLNPAMAKLFGASEPESLLGKQVLERIAPEYRKIVLERIRIQRETGKSAALMEQEYLRLDGSQILVETTAVPIQFEGRAAHLVFIRDISERKRLDAEKGKLEAQLRQAQKMEAIGRLAGGVAHDFNNLLTVILGRSEMLLNRHPSPDRDHHDLELIRGTALRAAGLTKQLLQYSRQQPMRLRVFDLNAAITDMEKMLHRLIGEDVDLSIELSPDRIQIKADPGQIQQVLMFLQQKLHRHLQLVS